MHLCKPARVLCGMKQGENNQTENTLSHKGVKQFKFCILFSHLWRECRKVGRSFPLIRPLQNIFQKPWQPGGDQKGHSQAVSENSLVSHEVPQLCLVSRGLRGNRYSSEKSSWDPMTGTSLSPWTTCSISLLLTTGMAPSPPGQGEKGLHTAAPSPPPTGAWGRKGFQAGHLFHSRAGQSSKDVTSNCQETAGSCLCCKNFLHPRAVRITGLTLY